MKKLKNKYQIKEFSDENYPLENFSDIHIHTSPDVKPRLLTDIGAVLSAKKEKMHSIVLKSHQEPTSGRALIASEVTRFPVFGGVVLNNSIGGLNPAAVKASAEIGGRFVWFPTVSYSTMEIDWVKIEEILNIVAENNMVIGTGHMKPADIFRLLDMAKNLGIWRIIVNHPLTAVVGATIDEQVEMANYAYIEHCFVACMAMHDKLDPTIIGDSIKEIGAKRCLMATDFGQIHNPLPVNGLKMFISTMFEYGISMDEISLMCSVNPQKLLLG